MTDWAPLVSIVTPTYNQAQYLEETIASVLGQDYAHVEYIVINGGSTDNTEEILSRFEGRLKAHTQANEGQTASINRGFQMACGEIVAWLNSDDTYVFRTTLTEVVDAFGRMPEVDVVYGDAALISGDGRLLKILCTPTFHYEWLIRGCRIIQPSAFFRRRVIEAELLDPSVSIAMDYEYWLRVGRRFRFRHVPRLWATDRNQSGRKILSKPAELAEQRRALRRAYGQEEDAAFRLRQLVDKLLYGLPTRVKGLWYLPSLYAHTQAFATPLRLESPARLVWHQLVKKNHELL